ncbi:hypothetical protein BGX20_007887, partial [Mortierella sp. AD010]
TEECKKIRPLLASVRKAESREALDDAWKEFKRKFPRKKVLIDYIEKNWMAEEVMPRWVAYARE